MYTVVAVHHPTSERFADAMNVLQSILGSIEGSAGLVAAYVGNNSARTEAMAMTLWQEKEQFDAVFPQIQAAVADSGIWAWAERPPKAMKYFLSEDKLA